jgi:hypothetical protein
VTDPKVAKQLGSQGIGSAVILDPELQKIAAGTCDAPGLVQALKQAEGAYKDAQPTWIDGLEAAKKDSKPLVVVALNKNAESNKNLLAALSNRWVTRLHGRFSWFKAEFDKDSELAKTLKIQSAPAVLVVDPAAFEAKGIIERFTQSGSAYETRQKLERSLKTFEERRKRGTQPTSR